MLRLRPPGSASISPEQLFEAAKLLRNEFDLRQNVQRLRLELQDAWLLMYMLVDLQQDAQVNNRQKHYSNRAASMVDTAQRVLSRNPLKYRVFTQQTQGQSRQEREPTRVLENVLHGLQYDIDRQLRMQGQLRSRSQAAFHGLVRGAWAYKLHLTKQAGSPTGSPIFYAQLDPRATLPVFDRRGQESVIAWDVTTLGKLYYEYPEALKPIMETVEAQASELRREKRYDFLHAPLLMIEWSSREESAVLVDLSGLPDDYLRRLRISKGEHTGNRYFWVEQPYEHGLDRCMIQTGAVNGVPVSLHTRQAFESFKSAPFMRLPVYRGGTQTEGFVQSPPMYMPMGGGYQPMQATIDPMGALSGRSMYANVAHLLPEMNNMLAVLKDAVHREIRGTWTAHTRDGRLMQLELGTGKVNPFQLSESLQRIPMQIQTPDAMALLQILNQEINDGSLDLRFILASESDASGYLRARMEQAALIAIDPYRDGLQDWANSLAESFIEQYRKSAKDLQGWKLAGVTPGAQAQYFVIDMDDNVTEAIQGKEPPVIEARVKAAMPIDMMAKINMAKAAIDPSNPIMGLAMALDMILELDDAEAAWDMIFEDIANRNPTLQLVHIANALAENNAPEVAQMILTDQFRGAFAMATQQQRTTTPTGAPAGTPPGTLPPEQTSGGGTEATPRALIAGGAGAAGGGGAGGV